MNLKKSALEILVIFLLTVITGILFNTFSGNGISLLYSRPVINDKDSLSVGQVYQLYQEGQTLFIDARSVQEYKYIRIEKSLNLPVSLSRDQIADRLKNYDRNQMMVVYCTSRDCNYSDKVAGICRFLNYSNVSVFKGGIEEWDQKGYPLVKPGD